MDPLAPQSRRPRPVAGLPAVDARAVAKAWLVELIAGASLEEAAALPATDLAREGPGLAAAVLDALVDDTALRRLAPGGNLAWLCARAATFTGPAGPGGAVRAAEALRRATQSTLLAEARLDAVTTAELADRLAHVCSVVAEAAASERPAAEAAPPAVAGAVPDEAEAREARRVDPRPAPIAPPDDGVWVTGPYGRARRASDEGEDEHGVDEAIALHRAGDALRERHERRAEPGSGRAAVERRLERHLRDGSPFALLAVEADGVERLLAAQEAGEVDALLDAVERALAAELRPADQLRRDAPGRYWVTAPDTGPTVGRLLAERLAEAATAAASHRNVPLTVSVGIATCPEDGTDAESLEQRADEAMFRARAAGEPVA